MKEEKGNQGGLDSVQVDRLLLVRLASSELALVAVENTPNHISKIWPSVWFPFLHVIWVDAILSSTSGRKMSPASSISIFISAAWVKLFICRCCVIPSCCLYPTADIIPCVRKRTWIKHRKQEERYCATYFDAGNKQHDVLSILFFLQIPVIFWSY